MRSTFWSCQRPNVNEGERIDASEPYKLILLRPAGWNPTVIVCSGLRAVPTVCKKLQRNRQGSNDLIGGRTYVFMVAF